MPHTSDDTLLTAGLSSFRLDLVDHIAHLVLNRPDAFNTLNPRFWQELDLVLDTLQRSGPSRALVISSTACREIAADAARLRAERDMLIGSEPSCPSPAPGSASGGRR